MRMECILLSLLVREFRMSRTHLSALVFALLLSFCTIGFASDSQELRVMYNLAGKQHEAKVMRSETQAYVRAFVAGQAPQRIPDAIAATGELPRDAKIFKVKECRSGQCTALRGLYAGRSPEF
jgi:hypothetical protein